MFNAISKFSLLLVVVLAASSTQAFGSGNAAHVVEVVQSLNCSDALNQQKVVRIRSNYQGNKIIVQIISIDLNGDEFCDVLVEYQEEYSVCSSELLDNCDLMKQGQWTDFYLATSNDDAFAEEVNSVERARWTDGGQYYSYKVVGNSTPYIVWDLRNSGRKSSLSDSYTVFKWHQDMDYLSSQNRVGVLKILCQFFNLQHNDMRRIDYDRQI